ncbi:replication-relaxation family protein [Kitasatospora sp. NPDC057223]|uniref:replication-relaxation family protein n=1 Tax=Kitasatospora sp. NPDC057223 TaxID=3346055 RepID=UPI00363F8822
MGSTARGAGESGAPHAMAVNETVLAFVRGGTEPGAAGGIGTVTSWATEAEFSLGGRRKVRPDAVWEAPEIGMPVLMAEVDRSTMSPASVAEKFAGYRELFRARSRDNDPVLAEEPASERMTHWWRRGPTRGPSGRVTRRSPWSSPARAPTTLGNRAAQFGDLAAESWRGRRRSEEYSTDSRLDSSDAVPILVASLDRLAELGPLGQV